MGRPHKQTDVKLVLDELENLRRVSTMDKFSQMQQEILFELRRRVKAGRIHASYRTAMNWLATKGIKTGLSFYSSFIKDDGTRFPEKTHDATNPVAGPATKRRGRKAKK